MAGLPAAAVALPAGDGGEGGEGGEGGDGGSAPSQYRLLLDAASDPRYSAQDSLRDYAEAAHAAYRDSAVAAEGLRSAVRALLDDPTPASLELARAAWLQARQPYLRTEAMRYYDGPIDGPASAARAAGPEGRLNAWPLNEAVIDYVEGDPDAGLVHEFATPVTRETVLARDQVSDEADVTTGWHAIEFLLWGQDRSADGPGARPASDYLPGEPARDRRRAYLALLVDQLVDDLRWLEGQWNPAQPDAYVHVFLALEQHEAIGRVLTGAANLAGHELASERLAVALDSGAQEDEQSCFSDSTRQDFVHALEGVRQAWYGRGGRGRASVLKPLRPALAAELDARFARAEAAVAALPQPFDRMLVAAPDSPERQAGEAAVTALQELGAGLRDAGTALGVLVIVSGV